MKGSDGIVRWKASDEEPPYLGGVPCPSSTGRLVRLDKMPGVQLLVGFGEALKRVGAKCVFLDCRDETKEACRVDHLYGGPDAGIEGGIHAAKVLWQGHSHKEEWGILVVDARDVFNEGNRMLALWTIRHEWVSGSRDLFSIATSTLPFWCSKQVATYFLLVSAKKE